MEWAEYHFRNRAVTADGTEAGDHFESAQRQLARLPGRKRPKPNGSLSPEGPPFPEPLEYLWQWFEEISMGLPISGMAPPVVSWDSLQAWQRLTVAGPVERWEAYTLVQLGMLRAGIQAEANRNNRNKPPAAKQRPPAIGKGSRKG